MVATPRSHGPHGACTDVHAGKIDANHRLAGNARTTRDFSKFFIGRYLTRGTPHLGVACTRRAHSKTSCEMSVRSVRLAQVHDLQGFFCARRGVRVRAGRASASLGGLPMPVANTSGSPRGPPLATRRRSVALHGLPHRSPHRRAWGQSFVSMGGAVLPDPN